MLSARSVDERQFGEWHELGGSRSQKYGSYPLTYLRAARLARGADPEAATSQVPYEHAELRALACTVDAFERDEGAPWLGPFPSLNHGGQGKHPSTRRRKVTSSPAAFEVDLHLPVL
jgi:hypothetical protein